MIFDSHFHLPSMVSKSLSSSLPSSFLGLECATLSSDMEERIRLVGKRRDVFLSTGEGPWALDRETWKGVSYSIEVLKRNLELFDADAIGECGFDNHWQYGTKEEQRELFIKEAELARKENKVLIVHSREADEEILSLLPLLEGKTIMHCFSSSPFIAEKLLKVGVYLSFAGNVTYRSNKDIQESAALCPLDRILYETDAPYLSPIPMRGKPCLVEYTEHTLSFLSSIKNIDREELKKNVINNFKSLFQYSESVVKRDSLIL